MGGDYSQYRYFVGPIVLQSWGNGSQSRPIEPGLHSWDPSVEEETRRPLGWREPVMHTGESERCRPIRNWWYVVFGIARNQREVP
jgi:hypothetical protein